MPHFYDPGAAFPPVTHVLCPFTGKPYMLLFHARCFLQKDFHKKHPSLNKGDVDNNLFGIENT